MFKKILASVGAIALILDVYILTNTSPSTGVDIVLVFFILSYIVLVSFFSFFLYIVGKLIYKFVYFDKAGNQKGITFKKSYYYASIFALTPIILVSLKSVGRSGVFEWLIVFIFIFLGSVYVSREAD